MATVAELIEQNTRLVYHLVPRYSGRGVDDEDLIQEGMYGLTEAVLSYDPSRGSLYTWACLHAGHRMYDAVRSEIREQRSARLQDVDSLADASNDEVDLGDFWRAMQIIRARLTVRKSPIFFAWLGLSRCGTLLNRRGPLTVSALMRRYHLPRRTVLSVIARGLTICRDCLGIDCDLSTVRTRRTRIRRTDSCPAPTPLLSAS